MSEVKNIGFTDDAAEKDLFEIDGYIQGLAQFIGTCNTPMTISIQGSWGTGKTSLMNIVKNKLSDKVKPIWFNTWQFSQFNMDEQLPFSLLSCLISEFDLKDEKMKEDTNMMMKGLKVALGVGRDIVLHYVDQKVGGFAAGRADELTKDIRIQKDEKDMDTTNIIKQLRGQFADCVEKSLNDGAYERAVIFIDDLDRLDPRRAVELLEVLKIFLDCEKCVFVLAIDYDVVCRGVAAKYGALADNETDSAEKGRSFFDKIIQVPFKMPVARYNIQGYVSDCFSKIGIHFADENELEIYVDLIRKSIGTNPRAMKRLFNSYQLLTIVVPPDVLKNQKNHQLLFAILCLQYCSEPLYNFIIRNSEEIEADIFEMIVTCKYTDLKEKVSDIDELTEDDLESAQPFMEKFMQAMDLDDSDDIDEEEISNFRSVLKFSTITSATDETTPKRQRAQQVYAVKDLKLQWADNYESLERVIKTIMDVTGEAVEGPIMKNRKSDSSVSWNFKQNKSLSFYLFERKNGFSFELDADISFYENVPERIKAVMEKRALQVKSYQNWRYIHFVVRNGNEEDERDMVEILQGCLEFA